jgi:homoserine dehydrogenase
LTFDLVLVGFGHVGRRFVRLLDANRTALESGGLGVRIVGVATRRHGHAYASRGLDAIALADRVELGERVGAERGVRRRSGAATAFIRDAGRRSATAARQGRLVVVETTTLDIERGQPAIDHVRTALDCGAHVVTANKGPVAFAYGALARAAERAGRRFLFEGAVMDGIPIFNLVRDTLPGVSITGFRGVVNSTTNYILTAMESGEPFGAALAAMQRAGIAEADASFDVDGWDAAAKTAALANVLLGARLTPASVAREGVAGVTPARVKAARAAGRRLKLVARAERAGRAVLARVAPEELPGDDLLAGLEGQQNALVLQTDLLGEIAIVQRGSGLTMTAYALMADLITIARQCSPRRRAPRARR